MTGGLKRSKKMSFSRPSRKADSANKAVTWDSLHSYHLCPCFLAVKSESYGCLCNFVMFQS